MGDEPRSMRLGFSASLVSYRRRPRNSTSGYDFSDQASAGMRRSAFSRAKLIDIATFPAEARLFKRVDQPVIAATFRVEPRQAGGVEAVLRIFGADRAIRGRHRLAISRSALDEDDYALPVGFGSEVSALLLKFKELPRLADLEGEIGNPLWTGRELDETRIVEKLVEGMRYPFVKGRMIKRYGIVDGPNCSVRADLAKKFRSARFERIAWRDVARASQHRRMICTLIPPGWIAGNSLHVAHFNDGDPVRLRALCSILSSFVFEFQVRSCLSTGHMSLGIVRKTRLPYLKGNIVTDLARTFHSAIRTGNTATIEVKAARAYGLRERNSPR